MMVFLVVYVISVIGEVGEYYINFGVGFGIEFIGLVVLGNWLYSDNDGDVVGLGLGFNILLGLFFVIVGGKGIYINLKQGDEGYVVVVGGGLQWKIGDSFCLYGDYYYFLDLFFSGIDSYQEVNVGVSWIIMCLFSIQVGYCYLNLVGKDGNCDNIIVDGLYIGVSVSF